MKVHYEVRITDTTTNEIIDTIKRTTVEQGCYHYYDRCKYVKVGQRIDLVEVLGYEVTATLKSFTRE